MATICVSRATLPLSPLSHYHNPPEAPCCRSSATLRTGTRQPQNPSQTPYNRSMKNTHKQEVRLFILTQLKEINDLRWKLSELAEDNGIDHLEAMEFFENEVERINKLFNYPAEQLEETV